MDRGTIINEIDAAQKRIEIDLVVENISEKITFKNYVVSFFKQNEFSEVFKKFTKEFSYEETFPFMESQQIPINAPQAKSGKITTPKSNRFEAFESIDLFSEENYNTINGKHQFKTAFSGVVSLIGLVVILVTLFLGGSTFLGTENLS